MPVEISSVQITGITTVVNLTDAVSKEYVDTSSGITTTSDDGNRLFVYSDGTNQIWEPIGAYQEYTTPGNYTFTVPTQAKQLFIEATGAGGGGASGNNDDSSFINDGIYWVTRINTFGNPINTLIYGGGYYVASGGNLIPGTRTGQIRVSVDTVTWTLRTSSNINGISASVYKTSADNPYVVGGYGPLEWTQRTSGITATLNSAMYDGTDFFAGGTVGFLIVSTDGITWRLRNSGITSTINSLVFASGETNSYVYCAASGVLSSSTDGIIWTLRTTNSATLNLTKVIFASGETNPYVVCGASGRLNVSTDAIQWVLRTTGNITNTIVSIVYNSSTEQKYVIGRNNGQLQTSTNAIQWVSRTTGAGAAVTINSIIYQDPNFVAGCSSGVIITSTNAIQWTLRTSGFGATSVGDIIYGNGIYVASGSSGICATSTDTITWTSRVSGFGITIINKIAYGNDIYLNVGGSGLITTSTNQILSTYGRGAYLAVSSDTITWTLRTTGINTQNITALASNNSFYVAGQQNSISESNIIVSTDSINWVVRTSPFSSTIDSIIYDETTYFIGGSQNGECVVSTDTIIWTLRTSGFGSGTNAIISVVYGLVGSTPTYVATGYPPATADRTVLSVSTDTITWTLRTSGLARSGTSLGYNNGIFMLATGSFISTSTDTITWILRTSGFAASGTINAIIYGLSEWSAAGSSPSNGNLVTAPNPGGFAGSGGGGGATVSWNISKAYITGSSMSVNVGQGGSAGQAGAASTVSWTGNSGTYTLTANGGIAGTNTYNQSTIIPGGSGASIPSTTSNYLTANAGTDGGRGGLFGSTFPATTGTNATTGFQATGGGGGNYTGGTGVSGGIIYYYNNTTSAAAGVGATVIPGLSYGNGGGGGNAGSAGGSGVKGGGGGGGGYDSTTDSIGIGGSGGDGYVRISWQ
jgi:hypothetical protein